MELDEKGSPVIPEDLKNKPQSEWTYEDWQRSGGSGVAKDDYSLELGALSLHPKTKVIPTIVNTAQSAVNLGKTVWNSPFTKNIRKSDFVQNFGKDPTQAGDLQKTVTAIDDVLAIPSSLMRQMSRIVKDSGLSQKDLIQNFTDLTDLFNQTATVNFDDKILDSSTWEIPEGYYTTRQSTLSKLEKQRFWKNLDDNDKLNIRDIIINLDNYHQRGLAGENAEWWNPARPTRGFRDENNEVNRTTITESGQELGIRWSTTDQAYKIFDVDKNRQQLAGRFRADTSADDDWSNLKRKARLDLIKSKNRLAMEALERIRETNPNLYLDIVGSMDNPDTVWTVEHIHSRDSGQWIEQADGRLKHKFKVKANGEPLYFGDSENLMPATGTNYGRLKTNIERHLRNSEYFVDINPKTRNFVISRRSDGKPVSFRDDGKIVEIHGMTAAGRWRQALDHVMNGGDTIGLVDTNPEVPTDLALTQPGLLGKDENTRVDPTSGNPPPFERTVGPYEEDLKVIEDNLSQEEGSLARYWREILDDHESGVEVIENEKTLQRYKNKWNKILLRAKYKQMELKFNKDWGQ